MLLERILDAFSLDKSNCIEKYALLLQKKPLDLGTCVRFSPVSFGCTLDMVEKNSFLFPSVPPSSGTSSSSSNREMYSVCLQDMSAGNKRHTLVLGTLNVSLLQVLSLFEKECSLCIFERKSGSGPAVEISGNIFSSSQLASTTLATVGGKNALLRLSFVKYGEKLSLESIREKDLSQYLYKEQTSPPPLPSENTSNVKSDVNSDPKDETISLNGTTSREYTYLPQLPHTEISPEADSDSFYQFSAQEFKDFFSKQHQNSLKKQDAPLMSARFASTMKINANREHFTTCMIRFRFDDYSAIDVTFSSGEKVFEIFKFLAEKRQLQPKSVVLSVPGQLTDLWEYKDTSLFDAGLIPKALVVVKKR